MNTQLKIYADRLKSGAEENIKEEVDSSLLDINEPNLRFAPTIKITGKAYLANDHLIIQLQIQSEVTVPCAICNDDVTVPLSIKDFIHTHSLSSIPSHVIDYTNEVREAILLNTPDFTECHKGKCPERAKLKKFIKTEEETAPPVQFPFSDLDK